MSWGTIIGGWSAAANGLQPGKYVELEVTQQQAPNGAKFNGFSLMKRYQSKKPESLGEWKPTFSFRMDDHAQIVERLNYLIQHFCGNTGKYVFMPHAAQQPQAYPQPQQQLYPQQSTMAPVQAPPGYAQTIPAYQAQPPYAQYQQQPQQVVQQQPVSVPQAAPIPPVPVTQSGW
jgi:hypothetical protein